MAKIETMLDKLFYSDTAKELTNSETLLYILLLWRSQKENPVQMSYEDIKEYAGISNATITKGVKKMMRLGMIKRKYQMRGKPCSYFLKEVQL